MDRIGGSVPSTMSQAEAEAGTSTADRIVTAERIAQAIAALESDDAVDSVNGNTGTVVLNPDDLDDSATTNKFVTAADLTVLSNTSGTNSGDEDASSLAAKGALMDSEVTNLAQVKAFDTTNYATAAQGSTADSALQPTDIASGTITARADDIDFSGGSDGDVLTVQSDGSLAVETPASSGLSDVVGDTSPQLGGDLETNGNHIYSGDATDVLVVAGGSGVANGANLHLYGGSHASVAGDFHLRSDSVNLISYDHSAIKLTSNILMVAKTTTQTATFTAVIDNKYLLNFTSAIGDADLPTAVGNTGRQILLICASTNTKVVTVDPNSTETIDGATHYKMAAGDMLLLQSNGTNWIIVAEKFNVYVAASSDAGQSVTATTEPLDYEDIDASTNAHGGWDGSQFTAPQRGMYAFNPRATASAASEFSIRADVDGTNVCYSPPRVATANEVCELSSAYFLEYGEVLDFNFTATLNRSTEAIGNTLSIVRVA